MLQDGRLKGIKIGQQWRFSQGDVERLIEFNSPDQSNSIPGPDPTFPTHCVQTIQDLFAEVGQISALVIDMQGLPLTPGQPPDSFLSDAPILSKRTKCMPDLLAVLCPR